MLDENVVVENYSKFSCKYIYIHGYMKYYKSLYDSGFYSTSLKLTNFGNEYNLGIYHFEGSEKSTL